MKFLTFFMGNWCLITCTVFLKSMKNITFNLFKSYRSLIFFLFEKWNSGFFLFLEMSQISLKIDEDASFKSLLLNFWQVNHLFLYQFLKVFGNSNLWDLWILDYSTQNHSELRQIDKIKKILRNKMGNFGLLGQFCVLKNS